MDEANTQNDYLRLGLDLMISNWADDLIEEYKEGRKELNDMHDNLTDSLADEVDGSYINGMIDSMSFSIEWMETGKEPGTYRGIYKNNKYKAKQYDEMDILPDITDQLEKEREPLYMDREQRRTLIQLFRSFSDRERQCYVMYEAEQMSMQQIADRLNISKGTVQMYIKRARKKVNDIAS